MRRLARLGAEYRALEAAARSARSLGPGAPGPALARLIDPGSFLLELGLLMGPPEAITAIGPIHGRPAIFTTLVADHDTARPGARKVVRAQEVAIRCRVPIVYCLPAGLPEETPVRVLETAAILKRALQCVQVVMTPQGNAAEAGVLGALSGRIVAMDGAGVCSARDACRRTGAAGRTGVPPAFDAAALYSLMPDDHRMSYDMRRLLAVLLDGDGLQEFQPDAAREMICATARLGGHDIGVLANARGVFRDPRTGETRLGGIIYAESAEKCAYFIETMNQHGLPILFVQDVSGFMLGIDAERAGIIRAGARFVEAMATARVPRLVLTVNHASGAGYYAMAAQGFEPDFLLTWPTGRMGAMEGDSAVNALFAPQLDQLRRDRKSPDAALQARIATVRADYERWLDARSAAASGYVDAIVQPEDTRAALILALATVREHRGSHLLPCRRPLEFAL